MLSSITSCVLHGIDGKIIKVETDIANGLPGLNIVGLADISIKESKDRIRAAIKNSNLEFPIKRITINLSPAYTRKFGTHLDLPMAVGILSAIDQVDIKGIDEYAFLGELSLDGKLNKVIGALPMSISLRKKGIKKIIVPNENLSEISVIKDIQPYGFDNLTEVIDFLLKGTYNPKDKILDMDNNSIVSKQSIDFMDVAGQEFALRAMEIAASGGHNLILIGPPGAGKTMLAKRLPTILPSMDYEESIEVTKIYSIAGLLNDDIGLIDTRPFIAPHHTASMNSLIGGGRNPKPGDVSLAHLGVLFLDELTEFKRSVLEVLRQPMEDKIVTISRVSGTVTYPCTFSLVASMNPCPCGYYNDPIKECTCTPNEVKKYMSKLSGPLLDRIDLHIEVYPVKYDDLNISNTIEKDNYTSDYMRNKVDKARRIQSDRYSKENIRTNSELSQGQLKKYCKFSTSGEKLLKQAYENLNLSARSYKKIIMISRTIADLDESENILDRHIAEAIQYRSLDKKKWNY